MKPERIEELLAGSKYDATTLQANWGYSAHFKAGEAVWLDARINAARVQLLVDTLKDLRKAAVIDGHVYSLRLIDAALDEAGLPKESE